MNSANVDKTTDMFAGNLTVSTVRGQHPATTLLMSEHGLSSPNTRAHGLLEGLSEVLRQHGCPARALTSFVEQAGRYLAVDSEVLYMKRAKYMISLPHSQYLKNEPPSAPDAKLVWHGQFRRWWNKRLRSFCSKNTHLMWSFLQGKRAAAPASEEFVNFTYEKHRSQMAASDPIDDESHDLVMRSLEPVLARLNEKIGGGDVASSLRVEEKQVWPQSLSTADVVCGRASGQWHSASTSACFEACRKDGGQAGYLAQATGIATAFVQRDLVTMRFYPVVFLHGVRFVNKVVEFHEVDQREFVLRVAGLEGSYNGNDGRLCCEIRGVVEPLKVRVISKGNAAPYYLSKPLQQALHDEMRQMDCFRLVGEPVCPTHLIDIRDHAVPDPDGEGLEWCSVDYSAATDGLSARLSASILDRLTRGFPDFDRSRWRSVLAPHTCVYPKDSSLDQIDQVNGQLMGSILSFPVLCLANLGLYLALLSGDARSLSDKLSGVLVNGDDMLYAAPASMYKRHVILGKKVGLEMTVGKAYVHHTFASVNSQCFHYDLRVKSSPLMIPFFNVGLFLGQNKVLRVATIDGEDSSVSSRLATVKAVLSGIHYSCRRHATEKSVFERFVARHREEIERESAGRNWFIHTSLGGCGVPVPAGYRWYASRKHLRIAADRMRRLASTGPIEPACYGPPRSPLLEEVKPSSSPIWAPFVKETEAPTPTRTPMTSVIVREPIKKTYTIDGESLTIDTFRVRVRRIPQSHWYGGAAICPRQLLHGVRILRC